MSDITMGGVKQGRVDKEKLMTLVATVDPKTGHPYTHQYIADLMGVSRGAISLALKSIPKSMIHKHSVDNFRKQRADVFAELQKLIITYITPAKLKSASIHQLGNLFKVFYEKEKLELGQATEHVAVIHQNSLDKKTLKSIEAAIESATRKQMLEAKTESKRLAQGKDLTLVA